MVTASPLRATSVARQLAAPGTRLRRAAERAPILPQPPARPRVPGRRPGTRQVRAYIGLGANLADPAARTAAAVAALGALPGARVTGVSRLYRTRPVGPVEQPDFHNAVVRLEVPRGASPDAGALALLIALKRLERAMGRRERRRWGPREIDLDLLIFGRHRILVSRPEVARRSDPERSGVRWLEVPHPAAAERLFVLAPLADLAPGLVPPGWGESVAAAARRARAAEGAAAAVAVGTWDEGRRAWRATGEDVRHDAAGS